MGGVSPGQAVRGPDGERSFPHRLELTLAGRGAHTKAPVYGTFQSLSHDTEGSAAVYQLPDGKRVLRFTEFATSNGPDVRVYMVEGTDGADDARIKRGGFVSLGSLKGNRGDQNYEIPSDLNLETHRAVSIWCARFGVKFAAASLASKAAANK
jgi:hypothetical protein